MRRTSQDQPPQQRAKPPPSAMLPDLVARLGQATTLEDVVTVAKSGARRVLEAQGATFIVREGDDCFYLDEDAIAPLWKGQRFPLTECISGWAMLERETAIVPDITLDPRIPQAAYRPTFVTALLMAPVRRADPLAAIGAYWSQPHHPSSDRIAALETITDAVAEAIERIGLDGATWAPTFRRLG